MAECSSGMYKSLGSMPSIEGSQSQWHALMIRPTLEVEAGSLGGQEFKTKLGNKARFCLKRENEE